ncbi:glutaminyl-peptide cyclotransferase [Mucilaginibacter ginsenosidivorans]|uniref:Glutaminyl-peptide cyclotransferase n=1 Tax=Mucilaginibacter ginsenosidivorans TaxID=398053 RepID=A0A5B8V2A7_9SPHI|nr:glutaminyl-peptide cyclotransferase [Mucilaginibacter ginsenosidivorans]QEC61031.1 glutaminyl-peptide cyclotransferase [Mucilaginibacter ginsenosidivorans]QEC65550.1 glutaminyl-peptide cyclotransferase [Mucilaginibacter ginsenosidivorans]
MRNRFILFLATAALAYGCTSCNKTKQAADVTISPEAGTSYKSGDDVTVKVSVPADIKPDSIVYLVDSTRIASKKDSAAIVLKTDTFSLGPRVITAKVFQGGKSQDATTNIVLLAAKAPEEMTYQVIRKFPHDTSAYTEGLLYQDGYLYETTGTEGHSDLRKVDLNTGKVVQRAKLDPQYFGEGSAIIGDKIVMFTYRSKVGFVFDRKTFKLLKTFNNNVGVEGWGVTYDGKKMYLDDSTNRIWFLDPTDYRAIGSIDVYDDKGPVDEVNELEYIHGKLYSNVYTLDTILVINPKTGAVEQRVDMKDLWPLKDRPAGYDNGQNVLNGIAWDEKGQRLFVTGKKWPYLYQVKFVPLNPLKRK